MEFLSLCRLCLNTRNNSSIFGESMILGPKIKLSEKIRLLTDTPIFEGDSLPTMICDVCRRKINIFFYFREQSKKNFLILQQYLLNLMQGIQSQSFEAYRSCVLQMEEDICATQPSSDLNEQPVSSSSQAIYMKDEDVTASNTNTELYNNRECHTEIEIKVSEVSVHQTTQTEAMNTENSEAVYQKDKDVTASSINTEIHIDYACHTEMEIKEGIPEVSVHQTTQTETMNTDNSEAIYQKNKDVTASSTNTEIDYACLTEMEIKEGISEVSVHQTIPTEASEVIGSSAVEKEAQTNTPAFDLFNFGGESVSACDLYNSVSLNNETFGSVLHENTVKKGGRIKTSGKKKVSLHQKSFTRRLKQRTVQKPTEASEVIGSSAVEKEAQTNTHAFDMSNFGGESVLACDLYNSVSLNNETFDSVLHENTVKKGKRNKTSGKKKVSLQQKSSTRRLKQRTVRKRRETIKALLQRAIQCLKIYKVPNLKTNLVLPKLKKIPKSISPIDFFDLTNLSTDTDSSYSANTRKDTSWNRTKTLIGMKKVDCRIDLTRIEI